MSKKSVHVSKVEKISLGKKKANFFRASFDNSIFFWSSLHEAKQKYGITDKEHLIYEIKALITEEAFEAFEDLCINKEPAEVPLEEQVPKEGASNAKLKAIEKFNKKSKLYIPYAQKAAEDGKKLYLTSLSRNALTSKGNPAKVNAVGRNPNLGLTEKIGNGSVGTFRIGCIEGEDGGPSEGMFNSYLEAVQILKLEEYEEKEYGEDSLGEVGFGNYDEEEDDTSTSEDPSQEDDEDDGEFDEFDE